jgi:hypothetical protein
MRGEKMKIVYDDDDEDWGDDEDWEDEGDDEDWEDEE